MHILVVEDDTRLRNLLKRLLEEERHVVDVAADGEEGLDLAEGQHGIDIVVLDVGLPDMSGLEVARRLRRQRIQVAILMLTARDTVGDRVTGLDAGADDYLVKPFAFAELLARIRNLLRRGKTDGTVRMKLADLNIDLTARRVSRNGESIPVTAREFDLLECLMRNKGRVVSRETLAREVWKESARATPLDNVIDVHMARLRRKMDDPFNRKLLHTVRGVGFILRAGE